MDFLSFTLFCRNVIEAGNHPLPVRVELLDIGMNAFFDTEISLNAERTYVCSKTFTGNLPTPHAVRFTPNGKPAFLKDFPTA